MYIPQKNTCGQGKIGFFQCLERMSQIMLVLRLDGGVKRKNEDMWLSNSQDLLLLQQMRTR